MGGRSDEDVEHRMAKGTEQVLVTEASWMAASSRTFRRRLVWRLRSVRRTLRWRGRRIGAGSLSSGG
jgi:hypothetical protein